MFTLDMWRSEGGVCVQEWGGVEVGGECGWVGGCVREGVGRMKLTLHLFRSLKIACTHTTHTQYT